MHIYIYVYMYIYTHMHVMLYMYIRMCKYMDMQKHEFRRTVSLFPSLSHTYTHTHTHTQIQSVAPSRERRSSRSKGGGLPKVQLVGKECNIATNNDEIINNIQPCIQPIGTGNHCRVSVAVCCSVLQCVSTMGESVGAESNIDKQHRKQQVDHVAE